MPYYKHPLRPAGSRRCGYTLVEILLATALALLLLVSVIRIFMMMNEGFAESRVLLEMLGRMRNAQRLLELDLSHYTVTMRPPRPMEADDGYFACGKTGMLLQIASESDEKIKRHGTNLVNQEILAESSCEDYISLTVFNKETPFRCVRKGAGSGQQLEIMETPYAEVFWFVKEYDLYRVVVPIFPKNGYVTEGLTLNAHYRIVNLGELGKPENRITESENFKELNLSNYMVLPNVIHFEVQLWSPSDNQYIKLDELETGKGEYFRDSKKETASMPTVGQERVYDTWSTLMLVSSNVSELNGGDGDPIVTGLFSNSEESGKGPPSTAFLPGVRLVVRTFDPGTGEVREFRVAQDFRMR